MCGNTIKLLRLHTQENKPSVSPRGKARWIPDEKENKGKATRKTDSSN